MEIKFVIEDADGKQLVMDMTEYPLLFEALAREQNKSDELMKFVLSVRERVVKETTLDCVRVLQESSKLPNCGHETGRYLKMIARTLEAAVANRGS